MMGTLAAPRSSTSPASANPAIATPRNVTSVHPVSHKSVGATLHFSRAPEGTGARPQGWLCTRRCPVDMGGAYSGRDKAWRSIKQLSGILSVGRDICLRTRVPPYLV
jgi:hypothetical protein